jgi:hypothetical protein
MLGFLGQANLRAICDRTGKLTNESDRIDDATDEEE